MALSIKDGSFWDVWIMKMVRNVASVKYQCLIMLYLPVTWGMLHNNPSTNMPWISATEALAFFSGTFITLAASRAYSRSNNSEPTDKDFDTDR